MTSVSKNMYVDKLDDIVKNTIMHIIAQLTGNLLMQNQTHILTLVKKLILKILNLKLVILLEYQNIKIFLQKFTLKIGLKKFLWFKKVKNTVPWTYVISDLKGEETVGTFYEQQLQKTNQKEFRVEKVIKRKGDKLSVKWKGYDSSFNSWIYKKYIV